MGRSRKPDIAYKFADHACLTARNRSWNSARFRVSRMWRCRRQPASPRRGESDALGVGAELGEKLSSCECFLGLDFVAGGRFLVRFAGVDRVLLSGW